MTAARRIALVGTGGISSQHVAAIHGQRGRAELVAAVDIDPERLRRFAEEHGVPAGYLDVAEMLERERPELVCVATPPAAHAELAVRCMEAGAWVLCEKPLCASLAELDGIADVEGRTGRYCASVFQWRFGSAGRHLRRLIEAEALGRPLVGICQTTWYRDHAYYEVPWRGRWGTELGGATVSQGIHAIDLFCWLLGEWAEVSAMVGTLDRRIEVEDVSMAVVRFAGGAMGSIVSSVLSPRQETYLRLDFQRATVEVRALYHYTNQHWTLTPAPGADGAAWPPPADEASSHVAQLGALLDSMDRGEAPPAGTADVRPTFELLSSLYRSAAEGRVVRRGEIGPGEPSYGHVAGALVSRSV